MFQQTSQEWSKFLEYFNTLPIGTRWAIAFGVGVGIAAYVVGAIQSPSDQDTAQNTQLSQANDRISQLERRVAQLQKNYDILKSPNSGKNREDNE